MLVSQRLSSNGDTATPCVGAIFHARDLETETLEVYLAAGDPTCCDVLGSFLYPFWLLSNGLHPHLYFGDATSSITLVGSVRTSAWYRKELYINRSGIVFPAFRHCASSEDTISYHALLLLEFSNYAAQWVPLFPRKRLLVASKLTCAVASEEWEVLEAFVQARYSPVSDTNKTTETVNGDLLHKLMERCLKDKRLRTWYIIIVNIESWRWSVWSEIRTTITACSGVFFLLPFFWFPFSLFPFLFFGPFFSTSLCWEI